MMTAWNERIFVDELNHQLLVENPDRSMTARGRHGSGPGEFHYPRDVAVLNSRAYVVDSWNHRVQVFDLPSWQFAFAFGSFGSESGQFFCPSSIAVAGPFLAIADTNNSRLSFHHPDGACAFVYDLPRFPVQVRTTPGGFLEVQSEDGEWESL